MLGIGVVFMLILVGAFGRVGKIITNFFVGVFGYAVYAYFLVLIILGILVLLKVKKPKLNWVRTASLIMFFVMIISLLHSVSSSQFARDGYGKYLSRCYTEHNTAGGVLAGVFLYPLMLVDYLGVVITSLLALGFCSIFVFYDAWAKNYNFSKKGIPSEDMVDFSKTQSDDDFIVVGDDLNSNEEFVSERKRGRKGDKDATYVPLAELAESRESVVFESENDEEEQTESEDEEDSTKNWIERLKEKKTEKKEATPERDFDQAFDILYGNKPVPNVSADNEENVKNVLENKQDYESYTNNYRRKKVNKNLGFYDREEKTDSTLQSGAFEQSKPQQADYFAVEEIIINKDNSSNNIIEDIGKQEDSVISRDVARESVVEDNFASDIPSSITRDRIASDRASIFGSNNSFSSFERLDKAQEEKTEIDNKEENKKSILDDMQVEDKTAHHEEVNDFQELLRKKKAEREKRERELLEKRHLQNINDDIASGTADNQDNSHSNIDDNIIPSAEERLRKIRSDKGGTHQTNSFNLEMLKKPSPIEGIIPEVQDIISGNNASNAPSQENKVEKKAKVKVKLAPYKYPPAELLHDYDSRPPVDENFDDKIEILENTLSEFGIDAKVNNVVTGPTFTRLELSMPRGISVNKVASYVNDIAMCLEVKSVRCQIPIPGKNAFGVEIPNKERGTVGLKSVIQSDAFHNPKQKVSFALGQDCDGDNYVADLTTMPHLLIAGATGAGKSVCLNSLIVSLLYKYTPEELRLLLVDPKQVELNMYNRIPHLLIPEAVSDKDKALNLLDWAIEEMELRYTMFKDKRVQKITDYNACIDPKLEETKLPYIVIIIDEVGDFMVTIKKELEDRIVRLTQKARAAGIHLILATQRPSVDVITGIIKANLPSRIAFAVPSFADSKTIIDQGGAEKLLRNGDMIFADSTSPEAVRIQGTFVSGGEVNAICDYVRDNNEAYFDSDIEEFIMKTNEAPATAVGGGEGGGISGEQDDLFVRALFHVVSTGTVSISKLQRKFGIGFNRAGRLVDTMADLGYISEAKDNNTKPRDIYIDMPTFRAKYGDVNLE